MKIRNLKIKDFKIHKDIFLDFDSSSALSIDNSVLKSLITGKNSVGKTSILDAILMFSGSHHFSFSHEKNKDLINFELQDNKDLTHISVIEIEIDKINKLKLEITNFRKHYFINDKKIVSLKEFNNLPNILNISPGLQYNFLLKEGKRNIFENLISNLDLNYLKYKNDYSKLCQKRMKLIAENNIKLLEIVERQIIDIGIEILKIRKDINLQSSDQAIEFKKSEPILAVFPIDELDKNQNIHSDFIRFSAEQLKNNREIDFKSKRMLYSFIRFDFEIFLQKNHYNILSNSQQKQCIYEYIISNIDLISQKTRKKLILLIDEIDSFFDEKKMSFILTRLENKNISQIISTTPKIIDKNIYKDFSIIDLK